ncbi:hypothetical protein HHK36_020905 [Tetracentron sinense]|uniref:Uncharacterized protein n=1 Tax=Tetracentron sinense TaxID=13715 RepID=A0A834YYG7_TETSI|nr:hypothetical protein HHK36_020905 [Tetracentron sinense]
MEKRDQPLLEFRPFRYRFGKSDTQRRGVETHLADPIYDEEEDEDQPLGGLDVDVQDEPLDEEDLYPDDGENLVIRRVLPIPKNEYKQLLSVYHYEAEERNVNNKGPRKENRNGQRKIVNGYLSQDAELYTKDMEMTMKIGKKPQL